MVKHVDSAVVRTISRWLSDEGLPKHQTMGMADGYRKSYTRIHFRNWKMGTKYTYDSSNGLEFTISPPTVKTDYVQIDKTTNLTATTEFKGSGSMYYLLHNASKLTKTTFRIAGQEAGYRSYTKNEFTNSAPHDGRLRKERRGYARNNHGYLPLGRRFPFSV